MAAKQPGGTKPEHIAAALDEKTGKRKYDDLVHGSTPRLLCDIWRIVVDCFRKYPGEPKKALDEVDSILSKLPQLQVPQYSQMSLSNTHLLKLYPNLPNKRGFQFFATFPAPRRSLRSRDLLDVPLDQHKALCGTTLYASVPKEGVDDKLIKEWEANKAGLFRRDNNEFPHGLFDPAWRLKLETVAETLAGYFRHEEPKSVGETGELKRRVIVSLDKHFIGKETNPLDDDNEDAQDDEPIVTSNDLVLRSGDRNLQPLIDAGIENKYVSKLRQGKRLTLAELNIVKNRTKLMADGSLVARGAIEDGFIGGYVSDPEWAARLKTWRQLNKLGRFADVAAQAGLPLQDIEDAARYGDYDDKCVDTDWSSIQSAIDVLTGRTKRQAKLKSARQKAGDRKENHRSRRKVATLLEEIQAADFVVFPTDIASDIGCDVNAAPMVDELDAQVLRRELQKSAVTCNEYVLNADEIMNAAEELVTGIEDEFPSPAVEYWGAAARKQRAKTATALRVARHRKNKNDASP